MKEKENWMIENGFSKDGKVYCVGGGNTYLIKDQLKNAGFRYNQLLGWFSDKPKDVPAPYYIVFFTFDELYQWESQFNKAFLYKDAKEKIKTKLSFVQNDTKSEFIGEINERVYDLLVNFKNFKYIYPYYIYNFFLDDNKLVWVTKKQVALIPNQPVRITATIAAHEDFKGTKITRIKRCVIKSQ